MKFKVSIILVVLSAGLFSQTNDGLNNYEMMVDEVSYSSQNNLLVQNADIGKVLNPYYGKYVQKKKRIAREVLVTPERMQQLRELITEAKNYVTKISK